MSRSSDITAEASEIYASGRKLGKEISDMIVDTVTRHATDIEDFVNRRDELLNIDARFLWFFAIAVELDFASANWEDQKTRDVIEEITRVASRDFYFRSSSLMTLAATERSLQDNLLKMHENLQKNWKVLRNKEALDEKNDIIFDFNPNFIFTLYYLRGVYPSIDSLLGTGNVSLLASLSTQFGLKMIPSQFRQPSSNQQASSPESIFDRGGEDQTQLTERPAGFGGPEVKV